MDVVDLSDPDDPHIQRVDVPADGGLSGLQLQGETALVRYYVRGSGGKVRFHQAGIDELGHLVSEEVSV